MITKFKLYEKIKDSDRRYVNDIWYAIEEDNFELFKKMINKDIINDINVYDRNILSYCIDYLRLEMLEYIVDNYSDVVELQEDTLMSIVNYGQTKIIKLIYPIIRKYKNIKFENKELSLLLLAAHKGNFWLILALLSDDVDITVTKSGKTFIDFIEATRPALVNLRKETFLKTIQEKYPEKYKEALLKKRARKFKI